MTALKVGDTAPEFSLPDQNGNMISLVDFRDKKIVVLYFYPKAMTPGCTVQAQGIRDDKQAFDQIDTVVIGVSPDAVKRLCKFEERDQLNFTLVSDEEKALCEAYDVWQLKKFMGKEFMGVVRTTFIIGKDGLIKCVMNKVKTKTHSQDVLDFLKQHIG